MTGPFKLLGGVLLLMVVLVSGLYAYRSLMLWRGRTPEGYMMLTPVPGSESFEPPSPPSRPVLENQSASDLAVNFGYEVGGIPYSYSLVLAFPANSEAGHATMTVRHSNRVSSRDSDVVRRWDDPRHAYAVALTDDFDLQPKAPALCVKAVIGDSMKTYDLKSGSVCIAQRDAQGLCHPETLACGLIR